MAPRIWYADQIAQMATRGPSEACKQFVSLGDLRAAERDRDDLQRLPQPLKGFIPQTYGDAIMRGWIKHGDCKPHEWDNRTSAANARWMLERAGFQADRSGGE